MTCTPKALPGLNPRQGAGAPQTPGASREHAGGHGLAQPAQRWELLTGGPGTALLSPDRASFGGRTRAGPLNPTPWPWPRFISRPAHLAFLTLGSRSKWGPGASLHNARTSPVAVAGAAATTAALSQHWAAGSLANTKGKAGRQEGGGVAPQRASGSPQRSGGWRGRHSCRHRPCPTALPLLV